jgi:hypothetical protein
MFDRDKSGGRFYCTQHFGLSGTIKTKMEKKRIDLVNKENVLGTVTVEIPEKVLHNIIFHNNIIKIYNILDYINSNIFLLLC